MGENRSMDELERVFKNAIYENYAYVAIRVRMKGFKDDELIINTENNVESKLEYYKNTYDENLNHKYSQGISIVDFYTGDTLEEIEGMYENSIL